MRTTITLDDHLFARIKKHAAESGGTVSGVIAQSVRLMLQPGRARIQPKPSFKLITFGRGASFTNENIDKASALLAKEDIERYGKR